MASAPIYISKIGAEGLGQLSGPQGMPGQMTGQAAAQFGNAVGGLGQTALQAASTIEHVNRASTLADRQTKFLTDIDQVQQEFQNDPDPTTAPERFKQRVDTIRGEALKGLGQEDNAELDLKLSRQSISYQGSVRDASLKKQADNYSAGLDKQYEVLTRRYAQAGSDTEREAIAAELDDTLGTGIKQGMTTAKGAEAYRQSLRKTGDSAVILRQIASNPSAAQAALADPAQFAGLDPVQREQLSAQARAAAEDLVNKRLELTAKNNPAAAAAMVGRIQAPGQAAAIFDKAFIPQESGGNPNAQSVDGAAGVAQIMPGTAKVLVKRMGIGNWDDLPDAEIQQRLKADPTQTRQMGIRLFEDDLKSFNGHLAPAIAAYHAGSGGAVRAAYDKAVAAHGDNFTAEQFLGFMPASLRDGNGKTTVSYVRDIFSRLGGSTNGMGLSPNGYYRAVATAGAELQRQTAEDGATARAFFQQGHNQVNQFVDFFNTGRTPDHAALAGVEARLRLGAARNIPEAIDDLRKLSEARAMAPLVAEAKAMRIEDLTAHVAGMEQMVNASASPENMRRLNVFKAALGAKTEAMKSDKIGLAEMQGTPVTGLNASASIADTGFQQQLLNRGVVAGRIAAETGGETHFFKPAERPLWKARFESMGDNERFDLLRALALNTPNAEIYASAVKEIAGGDKLATVAGMFMRTNEGLAREIMQGASYLQLDSVKPKAEEVRNVMRTTASAIAGYPNTVKAEIMEAALGVYAARRGKNGTLYDPADKAGIEEAFAAVLGPVAKINGAKVPVPRSIPEWQVHEVMSSALLDKTLDAAGGAYGYNNDKFPAAFIGRNARLEPADMDIGNHRKYMIALPDGTGVRYLRDKAGKTLVIDLPQLVKQHLVDQEEATAAGTLFARRLNRAGGLNRPPGPSIPLPNPPAPKPFDGVQIP